MRNARQLEMDKRTTEKHTSGGKEKYTVGRAENAQQGETEKFKI